MREDIRPGAIFPDYELPDHTCVKRKRPSTAELHQDLREITSKVRPDYKIDTPETRRSWEAGDKQAFYPYGKSWKQVFARMAGAVDQFEDPKEKRESPGDDANRRRPASEALE